MAAAVSKMNSLVALMMCLLLLTAPAFSETVSPAPAPASLTDCHEQCIADGNWKIICNIKCFSKHTGAKRRHHHHHKHKGHHHASDEAKSPSPSSN